ncbi:probable inactive histone-lysine N-methyltransferase SUVR2 isoform X2 [Rhodamnia argentea]|uniref:Probable inactive histone-lysine N-methyltransferase SUVR2 isoform X2 n=2 Tax=Rhodamnia argentea TaxID=178133 RepID=A0ABM3HMS7_9MYRT|nr:probable inactive histone-lysine N-methyltransferase SUVR2 isoform X2 [Rhodamnia argentea]
MELSEACISQFRYLGSSNNCKPSLLPRARRVMAPNPRVKAAFMAMRDIGISEDKLKPVLKKLLKVYDKKWELIEEENYRVLADAIFDEEDDKVEVQKRKSTADEDDLEEEAQMHEVERPLKRLRLRNQESQGLASPSNQNSQLGGTSFQPVVEQQEIQSSSVQQNNMDKGKQPISPMALAVIERNNLSLLSTIKASGTRSVMSSDTSIRILIDKGKGPLSPHFIDRSFIHERPCNEPKDETYGLAVWHLEMKPCFWVGAEMCWRGWLGLTVAGTSWKGSQVIGSSTDDDRYS